MAPLELQKCEFPVGGGAAGRGKNGKERQS